MDAIRSVIIFIIVPAIIIGFLVSLCNKIQVYYWAVVISTIVYLASVFKTAFSMITQEAILLILLLTSIYLAFTILLFNHKYRHDSNNHSSGPQGLS